MTINLRSIDLNLLVIFEALVEERSVSRAAARIGLTPSAVSHALQRLRTTFGDEVLVRGSAGFEPTPHAVRLAATFSSSLDQISRTLDIPSTFDPSIAHRNFHLAVSDYVGEYVLTRLCAHLRKHAPNVSLTVMQVDSRKSADVVAYEGVELHLSIEGETTVARPVQTERLLDDTFMVLMRRGHPASKGKLSLEDYLALPHIKVTGLGSAIDNRLAQMGLVRRVMVKVPSWTVGGLAIVESSDLVVLIPRHWTRISMLGRNLVAKPLPLENYRLSIDAVWHPRNEHDTGHRWFRDLIKGIFKDLEKIN